MCVCVCVCVFTWLNCLITNDTIRIAMASFDIKSLFTNIPLEKTINIIVEKCFKNTTRYHGFTREQFTKLLISSVKNCHFLLNGVSFLHVDGVVIGSPFGPLFANIFRSFNEKS